MEDSDRPRTDQPLNAPKARPKLAPSLAVVGVIALIAIVFMVITYVRYHT